MGAVESDYFASLSFSPSLLVVEGQPFASITIKKLYPSLPSMHINCTFHDGTALAGVDYNIINNCYAEIKNNEAGEVVINIPLNDPDIINKPERYFNVSFTSEDAYLPVDTVIITITDNDNGMFLFLSFFAFRF